MTPAPLQRLIQEYSSFGIHRTGWPADDNVSRWVVDWMRERGIEARTAAFAFPKLTIRDAKVEVAGLRIDGTPIHDAGATGPGGVEGRIAVLNDPAPEALDQALAAPAALAGVIVISGDAEGCVILRNAQRMDNPSSLPALQIARRDAAPLLDAVASGAGFRLTIDRGIAVSRATNVVVDIPAPDGNGLVVIMTPKSGWFGCAAERAPRAAYPSAPPARVSRTAISAKPPGGPGTMIRVTWADAESARHAKNARPVNV